MTQLKRNFAYTLFSGVLPAFVAIVTVPFYLKAIGDQRYGVMAILWLVAGYFSFLELGMGRALTHRISLGKGGESAVIRDVLRTAVSMSSVIAVVGGAAVAIASSVYLSSIDVGHEDIVREAAVAAPFMGLAFGLVVLGNCLGGVLQAEERFDRVAWIKVLTTIAMQCGPLCVAVLIGPQLPNLVAAVVGARAVGLFLTVFYARGSFAGISSARFDRETAKTLISFGGWVSVAGVIAPLLVVADRMVMGATIGAAAVTYYTIPYNLAFKITVVPTSLATVIFPRLTYLSIDQKRELARKSLEAIQFMVTPMVLGLVIAMGPILHFWIGRDIAEKSTLVGQVIAIGVWLNCLARVPFAEIQASGEPRKAALWMAVQLAPYLITLYVAMDWFGLTGAAWVWTLRVLVDTVGLFWLGRYPLRLAMVGAGHWGFLCAATVLALLGDWHRAYYWIVAVVLAAGYAIYLWHNVPSPVRQMSLYKRFFPATARSS